MKILGIDPGLANLGLAVVEDKGENNYDVPYSSPITTSPRSDEPERIAKIVSSLRDCLESHEVECAVIEKVFFGRNKTSALRVAEVIGVIKHVITEHGVRYVEVNPNKVKQAIGIVGGLKAAVKIRVLALTGKTFTTDHVTDAVAIAIAYIRGIKDPAGITVEEDNS